MIDFSGPFVAHYVPKLLIFVYRFPAASHDNARRRTVWRPRAVCRHGPLTCTENLHRRSFRILEPFEPF